MIQVFVGLGNPGPTYEATRHNAGFWWIDRLAAHWRVQPVADKRFQAEVVRFDVGGKPRWLVKPQTFMNLSGQAVGKLAGFFKVAPANILVAHDELDLPPGAVKLKFGGGVAGHNGLKDIRAQLATPDFWRLRLGIGHPGAREEVMNWVLKRPSKEHQEAIERAMERTVPALADLLAGDMSRATMTVHTTESPRPSGGGAGGPPPVA